MKLVTLKEVNTRPAIKGEPPRPCTNSGKTTVMSEWLHTQSTAIRHNKTKARVQRGAGWGSSSLLLAVAATGEACVTFADLP